MQAVLSVSTLIVVMVAYYIRFLSGNPERALDRLMNAVGIAVGMLIAVLGLSGIIIAALWAWSIL